MVSKKKIVVGIVALIWLVLIAQHIWVHSKPNTLEKREIDISPLKTGTYIALWPNGAERYTINNYGTYVYEWISKSGQTKHFENIYTITNVTRSYLLSNETQDYFASDVTEDYISYLIEKWNYSIVKVNEDFALDLNLKRNTYIAYGEHWVWSDRANGRTVVGPYLCYLSKDGEKYIKKNFAREPPYSSDLEVYIFGDNNLGFDGVIEVIGPSVSSKSVEGYVPSIFELERVDSLSVSFQKKSGRGSELVVVIYDPQSKSVLASERTTASYGIVALAVDDLK